MDQRFLVFAIVVVPVLTVCFGFTVHYVVRPMVESLVDAIRDLARLGERGDSGERIAMLEAEVHELREEVLALRAATAFDRELLGDGSGGRLPPGSG